MRVADAASLTAAPPAAPRRRVLALLAGVTLSTVLGSVAGVCNAADRVPDAGLAPPAGAALGGRFALTDQHGQPFVLGAPGPATLVFFGFTACPAVCPTTLADAAAMVERLGPGTAPRVAFVSLDHERDTPEVLAAYVAAFDARFIGLTGTPAQIGAAADAYRVAWRKVPTGGSYTIDHSAYAYLLDESGRVVRLYAFGTPAEVMANEIARFRASRTARVARAGTGRSTNVTDRGE